MEHKGLLILILLVVVLVGAALGIEYLKQREEKRVSSKVAQAANAPYSIVTTYNGETKTARAFTWKTADSGLASVIEVIEGEDGNGLAAGKGLRISGDSTTLKTSAGKIGVHKAVVTGLAPGTTYTYRVGSGEADGWSEVFSFRTEANSPEPFTFLNVTDSQGVTEADFARYGETLDRAFAQFPEARFIVHNGDLTEDPEDPLGWIHFFAKTQRWVASIPLMPVTGNHDEVEGDARAFTAHFNLPRSGAKGTNSGTNYSFDYGTVHVAVLNSEGQYDKQEAWLRRDLAQTDKPWKIVALHRGPYGGNSFEKVMDWTDVFDEYGVDLVLQGHNHEYSRSYPLYKGKIVADGTAVGEQAGNGDANGDEKVAGDGGNGGKTTSSGSTGNAVRGTVYVVTNAAGTKLNDKKPDQFYHRVHLQPGKPMFAGITVDGNTLTYQAYDIDGGRVDEFQLVK